MTGRQGNLDDEDIEHNTNDDTDCDDGGSVNDQQPALEEFVQENHVRDADTSSANDERENGPNIDPLFAEGSSDWQHSAEADVDRRTGERSQWHGEWVLRSEDGLEHVDWNDAMNQRPDHHSENQIWKGIDEERPCITRGALDVLSVGLFGWRWSSSTAI